ncbi:MAG: T9SS type A sorting domain-containing protein [Flavobacteriales bacterium]|nr:T9SS type A sorting domain-containing protein [Flavobacteriales bacterium]
MGIRIGPDGRIWAVNATTHQLLRLDPEVQTGVTTLVAPGAAVHPNPATDLLYVTGMKDVRIGSGLSIYNGAGQLALRSVYAGDGKPVSVSGLASGAYVLVADGRAEHLRFVIQ